MLQDGVEDRRRSAPVFCGHRNGAQFEELGLTMLMHRRRRGFGRCHGNKLLFTTMQGSLGCSVCLTRPDLRWSSGRIRRIMANERG